MQTNHLVISFILFINFGHQAWRMKFPISSSPGSGARARGNSFSVSDLPKLKRDNGKLFCHSKQLGIKLLFGTSSNWVDKYCFSAHCYLPLHCDDSFIKRGSKMRVSRQRTRLFEQIRTSFYEDQTHVVKSKIIFAVFKLGSWFLVPGSL